MKGVFDAGDGGLLPAAFLAGTFVLVGGSCIPRPDAQRCRHTVTFVSPTTNYPPPYTERCIRELGHGGGHHIASGAFVIDLNKVPT